jgi:cysteine sulfinate desulfinase/cysteine desulfurase-like protein
MIYADNAATTKMDSDAFEAMKSYFAEEYGNASQPYFFAKPAKEALKTSREVIAKCIGAEPEEIYFTSGGTESNNWAVKSVLYLRNGRNRVVTSQIEHHAMLNACHSLKEMNIPVDFLPVDRHGILQPEILRSGLKDDSALVSVMLANNEIGTIEPIQELASIAHEHGVVFHTDAVQAVGHIPIDVKKLGVDMLSASAHKFNGMKGSGFLYIRKGVEIHPYFDGGSQERGMRAGTENIAAIVAMGYALQKNCARMENMEVKLHRLEDVFLKHLSQSGIDYIRNGSEDHLPGNINISINGADGEMLLHRLDLKGICISTGSACDSVNTRVSHVIEAIKVPETYAKGTIRVTFGWENTEDEAIKIADALINILLR